MLVINVILDEDQHKVQDFIQLKRVNDAILKKYFKHDKEMQT